MKSIFKISLIAGLLAAAAASYAMGPMGGQCDMGAGMHGRHGMQQGRMGHMDPAKMQAMMDKRHAALKDQLKLTAAQEPAWTAFSAAMKPMMPDMMNKQRPDPAEMAKLSTPERIDKMKTLRAQHMSDMTAAMDKRGEAAKTFYAVLTPEQQKTFDAHALQAMGGKRGGKPGHGGMGGQGGMGAMQPKS
ncbi:MAG: Spy/CpxP family protein refolding chaperone [Comamonadaceae bacterium]|nr:Spy/CpxP family protein refolding chaperone [Comamonadaceae bacterium]